MSHRDAGRDEEQGEGGGEDVVEVTRRVDIDAAVEDVWEVVADPVQRGRWLDDDDARRRVVEPGPVEPGRSVSWTWWHPDEDEPACQVEVTVGPLAPGVTRVVVTERRVQPIGAGMQAQAQAQAGEAGTSLPALVAWDLRLLGLELLFAMRVLVGA